LPKLPTAARRAEKFSLFSKKFQNFSDENPISCVYNIGKVITGNKIPEKMTSDPLYDAIRRYAARLLSDPDAGKDIAQEVFLRLEQNRETVIEPKTWAYKTARNLVIDQYRRSGRTTELPDDLPADATCFNPVILAERKETFMMIQQKIDDLSPKYREVLRLKFQEGLKYTEIAEVLGESVSTIARLLHEAITMLRKELTK
jgi:RNA polymerase sigma-70 factor (ECF subfamily)